MWVEVEVQTKCFVCSQQKRKKGLSWQMQFPIFVVKSRSESNFLGKLQREAENKELAWNWIWNSGFFCLSLILFQYFDILKGKLRKILVGFPSGERQKRARCVLSYSTFFFKIFSDLFQLSAPLPSASSDSVP